MYAEVPLALRGGPAPAVAVVLGSGLARVVETLEDRTESAYEDIGFPSSSMAVAGHEGRLVSGTLGGARVAVFCGRVHLYQGVSALDAAYPSRLAAALGASVLIATNAAGGLDPGLGHGSLVLISDHINLQGANPLVGWPGPPNGTPFVAMGDAYDPELRALARLAAADLGLTLREGVYAAVLGPSYETPAEVECLRRLGADIVGMSTVPEVIAARALGLSVLGISVVTNVAGGAALSHDEVLKAGRRADEDLAGLIGGIVTRLHAQTSG